MDFTQYASNMGAVTAFVDELRTVDGLTGLRIRFKADSAMWRLAPKTLRNAFTTLGQTIWVPSLRALNRLDRIQAIELIAHEARHALEWDWLFVLKYLSPQLPLLAITALAWIVCGTVASLDTLHHVGFGVGLIASLAPWPSPWRLEIERRGYLMNVKVEAYLLGEIPVPTFFWIDGLLGSWLYWKMSWGTWGKYEIVRSMKQEVLTGDFPWSDPILEAMERWLNRNAEAR